MNIFKLRNVVLAAAIASSLAACGGGGGVGGGFFGLVADGYVSGADVYLDVNDTGDCAVARAAGVKVKTDANGKFTFAGQRGHMVCVKGGTDLSTGKTLVGELKAPAPAAGGTSLVTPLTTLVVAKVKADKDAGITTTPAAAATTIATNLGLSGIDLLSADPVALVTTKPKLTQTTAAVQTMLVQASNSVVTSATGLAPTVSQTDAMFDSAVAGLSKAVAASAVVDMTTATAAAVQTLVNTAIQNTVADAQIPANNAAIVAATLAAGSPMTAISMTSLAPASVADVAATEVANLTQSVAAQPAANLATTGGAANFAAHVTQVVADFVNYISQQAGILTTAVANLNLASTTPINFANIGANIATLAPASGVVSTASATAATNSINADANSVYAAASSVMSASAVAAVIQGVTAPPTLDLSLPKVNNVAVNTGTTPYSVTVTGPLTNAAMTVTPIPATMTLPATASAGFNVTEVGGNRVLALVIDQVNVTNTSGTIGVTVPAGAKLYAYGKNTAGTTFSAVLANAASNVFTSTGGTVTVNWTNALTALAGQSGFANLSLVTGTFDVGVGLSGNMPLTKATVTVTSPADPVSFVVPDTAAFPNGGVFSGLGASIRVTVQ